MNKLHSLIILFVLFSKISYGDDSIPALKKLLSKTYATTFQIESSFYGNTDSLMQHKKYSGVIKRTSDYIYSKIDFAKCIYQEPTCLILNNLLKLIDVGPKKILRSSLLIPFYDPYELFDYALQFNSGYQKFFEGSNLNYDFIFLQKDDALVNVDFILDTNYKRNQDLKIKIIYHQLNNIVKDIIDYHFVKDISRENESRIEDFLEINDNNKYTLKPKYNGYLLGDYGQSLPVFQRKVYHA